MEAKTMTLRQRFDALLAAAFYRWSEPIFMTGLVAYSENVERARVTVDPDLFVHLVTFEAMRQRLQDAQGALAPLGEGFDASLEAAWARHEASQLAPLPDLLEQTTVILDGPVVQIRDRGRLAATWQVFESDEEAKHALSD